MADSIAVSRAKRQKIDKNGRMSALEKLKQLKGKGTKHKYDVDELENVYDTVDESEYSERVLQRQEDDWIEDDGTGYVEDGREIFDDDEIDDSYVATDAKESGRGQKRKARVAPQPIGKGNIRNLLGAMPIKKKEDVKISEDNILSDIMSDLDGSASSSVVKPKPMVSSKVNIVESSKKDAQNYFKSLSSSVKKCIPVVKNEEPYILPKKETIEEKISSTEQINGHTVPKKPEWKIDKEIKKEIEDSACQNIEEFTTQEIDFHDDFSSDTALCEVQEINKDITNASNSATNAITDVAEEFLNEDFEIFTIKKEIKELNPLTSNWAHQNDNQVEATIQTDGQLPLQKNKDGEKVLKFFWLDAWEDRFVKPGVVYIFGKVYVNQSNKKDGCASCCLVVKNVNRQLFLLPREYKLDPITLEPTDQEVTIMDVYQEFNSSVASELGLKEFKSRKVTRNYCFNLPDIPAQCDYLEVKYSATFPPPSMSKKYLTFSHIFGTTTSSLETFLLERKIKGPCWLEVTQVENVQAKVSWCKFEGTCQNMENVNVIRNDSDLEPPPIVMATLSASARPVNGRAVSDTNWLNPPY